MEDGYKVQPGREGTSSGTSIGTISIQAGSRSPVPVPPITLSCVGLPPHLNHLGAILLSLLIPLCTACEISKVIEIALKI
jgi:hypothetical protein